MCVNFFFRFCTYYIYKTKNPNDIWDSLDALDFFFEQVRQVFILFSVYWIILNSLPPFRSIAAWKVFIFGVVLIRILPHSDWICGKIRTRKTPITVKSSDQKNSELTQCIFKTLSNIYDDYFRKTFHHKCRIQNSLLRFVW